MLARLLDLDAEVHARLLDDALSIAVTLAGSGSVARVVDVGAGTGTGTFALARRFPSAEVVALDRDPGMLELLRGRASVAGLDDRVSTVLADIAEAAFAEGSIDVAWASSVMHEVGDPEQAFRAILRCLRPGGLLVILEMDAPPMLLPPALEPFEERLRAAGRRPASADHRDWAPQIRTVGFDLVTTQSLASDQKLPADGFAGDYARVEMRRLASTPGSDELSHRDTATLNALIGDGPGGVHDLGDLWIRGTRTVWAARRP